MARCALCKERDGDWMYQPWGPGDGPTFTLPGHHYRGFAALRCCAPCKEAIQGGEVLRFRHKGKSYVINEPWDRQQEARFVRDAVRDFEVHLLIRPGDDPDWDVAMCGVTPNSDRGWLAIAAEHSLTMGDLCVECMRGFVFAFEADINRRRLHTPMPED